MSDYPIQNYHFQVEWGGTKIGFTKVRNLGMGTHYYEYRHGASPEYHTTKQPARTYYDNLIFERGSFQSDNEFYDWWKETAHFFQEGNSTGSRYRRDLTISILNENHEPIIVWKAKNVWPVKVRFGDLDANSNGILMETLELVHEGLVVQND